MALTVITTFFAEGVPTPLVVVDETQTTDLTNYTVPTVTFTPTGGTAQNWPTGAVILISTYSTSIVVTPPSPGRLGAFQSILVWLLRLFSPGLVLGSSGTLTGNLQNGTGGVIYFIPTPVHVVNPNPIGEVP